MDAAGDPTGGGGGGAAPVMATKSKLRYPLRSAAKPRGEKLVAEKDGVGSSLVAKRGRPPSTVRRSVNVSDFSLADKTSRPPPRRFSVPSKFAASPHPGANGSITPIMERRMEKTKNETKSETPASDASKFTSRKKFSVLTSVSYWLSQIKLSESASNHSISLGFFKLAMESGCEPLQRMRDELKAYTRRHNLVAELGEPAKELLQSYNILEDLERLKVKESSSQAAEDGPKSVEESTVSSPGTSISGSLKQKSMNLETNKMVGVTKKGCGRKILPAAKTRASLNKNPANVGPVDDANVSKQKKVRDAKKSEATKNISRVRSSIKKPANEEVIVSPAVSKDTAHDDKENKENLVEDNVREEIKASGSSESVL